MDKLNYKLDKKVQIIGTLLFLFFIILLIVSYVYLKNYAINNTLSNQLKEYSDITKNDAKAVEDILNGKSKTQKIEDILHNEDYYSYITNPNGNIIYNGEKDDLKNIFKILTNEKKYPKELSKFKNAISNGEESGNAKLNFNKESSSVLYERINGKDDLYLISVLPTKRILISTDEIILRVSIWLVGIILVLTGICAYFIFTNRKYNKKLKEIIYKDALTGESSYAKFLMDAKERLKLNKNYAIYYADIKNFKYINDTYGYEVGDKLLKHISNTVKDSIEKNGLFARISADSFTALFEYDNKDHLVEAIYKGLENISDVPELKADNYKVEAYIGVYCTGDFDGKLSISEALDRANMAQKTVKGSSEFHLAFYNEEIRQRVRAEKDIETKMESALKNGEFVVYYQPKYDIKSGEVAGAEALVRWNSPENGLLPPGKFIPLFEQNGFIVNLDQYVFESVCKTVRDWLDKGKKVVTISINVSRVQFYRLDFVKRYSKIKNKYKIPDNLLELEFTESIVFENFSLLQKIVNNLKANGFSCSIDDFGSGYSSLNVLKSLPMDVLKLDRLFFQNSENTDRDKALIASVVTMARALKMKTVSEGIETWNQVNFLKEIGCDIVQGYVYSEPIPLNRFEHLMESKKRRFPDEINKIVKIIDPEEEEKLISIKNLALLQFIHGTVIEVDVDTGFFNVIVLDGNTSWDKALTGDNFEEVFIKIINESVHPDDRETVKARCLSMGVLASFYQGEDKIITDFRLLNKTKDKYEWHRANLIRLKTGNPSDFKAVYFVENIENEKSEGSKLTGLKGYFDNAIANIYTLIYELDFVNSNYKLLYYNKNRVGDQPENGDISWGNEYYINNYVHHDDRIRVLNFLNKNYILKEFAEGKEKISVEFRHTHNKKLNTYGAITIVRAPASSEKEMRFIQLCEDISDRKEYESVEEDSKQLISSAIQNYYDVAMSINLTNDTYDVLLAKNEFSDLPQDINYSELVNIWIKYSIHPNDRDKARGIIETAALVDALKKGKAASSCAFRYIDRDGGYRFAKLRCIRIPSNSMTAMCIIRDISDSMDYKDIFDSDIDSDPLKRLYKKESAQVMINKNLTNLKKNTTHAFILLDINDIESLNDGNTFKNSSKDDVLNELSENIVKVISKRDIILRTSGYEFTILLKEVADPELITERAKALCRLLKKPIAIDGMNYKISGNIGISMFPQDGSNYDELYMSADLALYKAKLTEEDSYKIYEKEN